MASLKFKEIMCILYSFILFISGILLIGFSSFLLFKMFYYYKFVPSSSIGPFIVLFLLGFIHLLITWLAIKGPTREHDFHIVLFMIITVILLIIECSTGIWSMVLWDEVDLESAQIMSDSFDKLIQAKDEKEEKYWAQFERGLKCCGFNGDSDYDKSIPRSCCNENINATCIHYGNGCKKTFTRYLKRLLIDAAIMGFCCCLMQAIGIFTFFKYFQELKQQRSARIARRLELQRNLSQESGTAARSAPPSAPHEATPPSPPVANT